jgi:CspA family cold shock protein
MVSAQTVYEWKVPMPTGTVKFFNTTRGFGFIAPDDGGKDVFVHVTAVEQAGMGSLTEGQKVNFQVEDDRRGPKAVDLSNA